MCGTKLANKAIVPSKLKRYLDSQHFTIQKIYQRHFLCLVDQQAKQTRLMSDCTSISYKGMEASLLVSQLIAQRKQPHTNAESLVVPCCQEIVRSMLGENTAKKIQKIPLSDNTVSQRINDMMVDILEQLEDKLSKSKLFSIQLDESTDIKGKCQLLANIRFIASDSIQESFLFAENSQLAQLKLKYTIQPQNFW